MYGCDHKKVSEVQAGIVAKIALGSENAVSSASTIRASRDRTTSPDDGYNTSEVSNDKPPVLFTVESSPDYIRSSRCLPRIFRCNRVAPLQYKHPGTQLGPPVGPIPGSLPTPGPLPTPRQLDQLTRPSKKAASGENSSAAGPVGSCTDQSASTKKRRLLCPCLRKAWGKRGLFRSNRIAPLAVQTPAASGDEQAGVRRMTPTEVLQESGGGGHDTQFKKSPSMLLARFVGLFIECIGKHARSAAEKPRAESPNAEDADKTIAAGPRGLGCCPCPAGQVTVASEPAAPRSPVKFYVGSQDDSDSVAGSTIMGQASSTLCSHSALGKPKAVANKQTTVTVEDLKKTARKLNEQEKNSSSIKVGIQITQKRKSKLDAFPKIDDKDLLPVSKKTGGPLLLGRGQSGSVRVQRLRNQQGGSDLVAIKRLIGDIRTCEATMAREISAMLAVNHCRIFPKFIGVVSRQSFAQEFIGNPKNLLTLSITKVLYNVRPLIDVTNWVLILHDVITGLSALHQAGWAHCDLQTNNVLLWRDRSQGDKSPGRWEARIIDLGNAKKLEGPSRRCLRLSPSEKAAYYKLSKHISAEIVEGLVPYNTLSDVYSLGVLMDDIANRTVNMVDLIPLAKMCLVNDPMDRPTLRALSKELNAWCEAQTGHRFLHSEPCRFISHV